jgi:hypothetical protein
MNKNNPAIRRTTTAMIAIIHSMGNVNGGLVICRLTFEKTLSSVFISPVIVLAVAVNR